MAKTYTAVTVLIRVTKSGTMINNYPHQYGTEIHVSPAMAEWLVRQRMAEILSQ